MYYENSPDYSCGDFQYTSPLDLASRAHAHDLLLVLVLVLVLEVELKLSNELYLTVRNPLSKLQ